MLFYNTFPANWRKLHATSNNLYTSLAMDIKNFILLKKKTADAEENKNKKQKQK